MIQSASFENRKVDITFNPFHYPLDSLSEIAHFAEDTTFSTVQFIGKSCETQNENSQFVQKTDSFFFYLILILIFGLTVYNTITKTNLLNFLKIGFFEKSMQDHEKKQVYNNNQFVNLLILTSLIFISIISFYYFKHQTDGATCHFRYFFIGIILFILSKILIVYVLGKIFNAKSLSKEFIRQIKIMYSSSMFILLIPTLLIISATTQTISFLFIATFCMLILLFIIRDIKFLIKYLIKNKQFICFFIYLCTIEILAIPLLVKILYLTV